MKIRSVFSRDVSQIVENAQSHNVEESCKNSSIWIQMCRTSSFSLCTDTSGKIFTKNQSVHFMWSCYWLIEQGLTCHQTHYRSYQRRFLEVIWPNQQCQSTEGDQLVCQIRLEYQQDHSTCYNNTTLGNRLYAWRMGPNVTNPICWTCKNCSYKCAADCEHCVTQPNTEQFW